jgi:hypothetical protein
MVYGQFDFAGLVRKASCLSLAKIMAALRAAIILLSLNTKPLDGTARFARIKQLAALAEN